MAWESFVEGFANSLNEGTKRRGQIADEYFAKQYEYATTQGLESRRRVQESVANNVRVARQLEQMGVPKNVIMAQANANPDGLVDFYNTALELQTNATTPITSDAWNEMYKIGGSFQAPDEDFATFFKKMYGPALEAANTDPEGFKRDPGGSVWARMFMFNPIAQAQAQLEETEVADGMSAADLVRYGDQGPRQVGGEAIVTPNVDVMRDLTGVDEVLSPSVRQSIGEDVKARVISNIDLLNGEFTEESFAALEERLLKDLGDIYVGQGEMDFVQTILKQELDNLRRAKGLTVADSTDDEITEEVLPPPPGEEPPPTETLTPPPFYDRGSAERSIEEGEANMNEPIMPDSEPGMSVINFLHPVEGTPIQLHWVRNNPDGTSTYIDVDTGEEVTDQPSKFREISRRSK
jgi:hypothetical protein